MIGNYCREGNSLLQVSSFVDNQKAFDYSLTPSSPSAPTRKL